MLRYNISFFFTFHMEIHVIYINEFSRLDIQYIEVRKCLLSFGAESFVFQVAIQKFKDQDIYRTITLPVVLYGCETWSLTLREERKLRVFENMVLRRIF